MPLQFPSNPTLNQTYEYNGRTWIYDGTNWIVQIIPIIDKNAYDQEIAANITAATDALDTNITNYIDAQVAALVNSSPEALDTLAELSASLGDDANFATTMTNALALKQDIASAYVVPTDQGADYYLAGDGDYKQITDFVGATDVAAGATGLVPQPIAGEEAKFLQGDGTWADVPDPAVFTGTDGVSDGTTGIVPIPAAGNAGQFLRADATWATPAYPSLFGGTDGASDGSQGLVPSPYTTDVGKFLNADGSWVTPSYYTPPTDQGSDSFLAGDGVYYQLTTVIVSATEPTGAWNVEWHDTVNSIRKFWNGTAWQGYNTYS